jgi:hypothetical protein
MGNPIQEKTQLEGEAYALLSFLQLWKASTKKEALTMELHSIFWPKRLLQNLLPPLLFSKYHSLDVMLNYGTSTIQKNGNPSPPSGSVFNLA